MTIQSIRRAAAASLIALLVAAPGAYATPADAGPDGPPAILAARSVADGAIRGAVIGGIVGGLAGAIGWAVKKKK